MIVGLAVPAFAIGLAIVFIAIGENEATIPPASGAAETQRLYGGLLQEGSRLGDPDAPVTIEYFTDVQCDECADYHAATIPPLIEEYVRDGKAKLELRHFSTSENVTSIGAYAATAAGEQERQWQYAHSFFLNLDNLDDGRVTEAYLRSVAGTVLELDESDWEEAIDSEEVQATVDSDAQETTELLLPAEPAVIVIGPGGERELTRSPSVDEIEAAVADVG